MGTAMMTANSCPLACEIQEGVGVILPKLQSNQVAAHKDSLGSANQNIFKRASYIPLAFYWPQITSSSQVVEWSADLHVRHHLWGLHSL